MTTILIVANDDEANGMAEILNNFDDINIVIASSFYEAVLKYIELKPFISLISVNLPVVNGLSLANILKGSNLGRDKVVCVFGEYFDLPDLRMDYFFRFPLDSSEIISKVKSYLSVSDTIYIDTNELMSKEAMEIEKARKKQSKILPVALSNDDICVKYLYSPCDDLSGDCIDYWVKDDKLYGFLFDCTGHGLTAAIQVGEIRASLKLGFQQLSFGIFHSLDDVMRYVNDTIFSLHRWDDVMLVAGIAFCIDYKKDVLEYCAAGIFNFFAKRINDAMFMPVDLTSNLLGYTPTPDFECKKLDLTGYQSIIFSSDGLSDLLNVPCCDLQMAQHDDVSAVFIQLKRHP